jgi:hypothetical protein
MTKTTRQAAVAAVVVAVLGWTSSAAATESGAVGEPSFTAHDARVRGVSARVVAIINDAAAQSEAFRGLVDGLALRTESSM